MNPAALTRHEAEALHVFLTDVCEFYVEEQVVDTGRLIKPSYYADGLKNTRRGTVHITPEGVERRLPQLPGQERLHVCWRPITGMRHELVRSHVEMVTDRSYTLDQTAVTARTRRDPWFLLDMYRLLAARTTIMADHEERSTREFRTLAPGISEDLINICQSLTEPD